MTSRYLKKDKVKRPAVPSLRFSSRFQKKNKRGKHSMVKGDKCTMTSRNTPCSSTLSIAQPIQQPLYFVPLNKNEKQKSGHTDIKKETVNNSTSS